MSRERSYEVTALLFVAAVFLAEIYPIIFTVHDDILTYTLVRHGDLWKNAVDNMETGRLPQLWNTILLGLPMLPQKAWFYKVVSYIVLLADTWIFYCLAKKIFNHYAAALGVALFWGLASITNQHNLFVSYILARQIVIGILMLSIYWFIQYYEKLHARYLWGSSFLYLAAGMLYEAAVPFGLVFFLIALREEASWKRKVVSVALPGMLAVLWLVVYFGWQAKYPTAYDGGSLYFGDVLRSLWSAIMYSFGSFPLYSLVIGIVKGHVSLKECAFPVAGFAASVVTATMWYWILPKIHWEKGKRYSLAIIGICIFLPNLILGFTPKYMEWNRRMVYTYLTTFYSYFFLLLFLVVASGAIYQKCRKKKLFLGITTAIIFLLSLTSAINNRLWKMEFDFLEDKYKAFDQALQSPLLLQYETGTYVYIPDYIGINGSMEYTQYYSKLYTDNTYEFRKDPNSLDFNHPVVEFRYIPDEKRIEIRELKEPEEIQDH